jgi:putative transposase
MTRKGHTEEQIIAALQQAEAGAKTGELCRKLGISQATFYNWKKQYAGLGVQELRELRQLREENGRLKRIVADLTLDRQILQEIVLKKAVKPRQKRRLVRWAQEAYRVSERRAIRVIGMRRSSCRYRSHARSQEGLRQR